VPRPSTDALLLAAEQRALALLAGLGLAPLNEDMLETMRSWPAISKALSSALGRVRRGLAFYARGAQVICQDIRLAASLVLQAARGHTLTQREVRAVRRTAKDVVMLVPFTVLLLIPLSPLGHVMVFGFLQRVWPGFFPSAFTDGRQGMLDMYSALLSPTAGKGSGAPQPAVGGPSIGGARDLR
jgi:hypothetical protein